MCNVGTGMCVPRTTTGTTPLGGACGDSAECVSGLCFGGACSQACNWLDVTSCPGGFYCNGQATGSCGSGLCQAGGPGAGALGAACAANTDCATIYCSSGTCSEPCIPGGAVTCDPGYACQVGATAGCGSCLPERGALGDPCMTNTDCASGICATAGATSFCTALCDPAGTTCPERFACTAAGPVSVCVPDGGVLGAGCTTDADCIGGICAHEGDTSYCTRICTSDPCPVGFGCVDTTGSERVCRPRDAGGGCGCSAAGAGQGSLGVALLVGALGILVTARRRRR
jgi:MYXO-CTERM domain-containing protein